MTHLQQQIGNSADQTNPARSIFVVGNSRSGTTLMGLILGSNPQVFTFEEIHFFEHFWSQQDQNQTLSRTQAEELAARLLGIQKNDFLTPADAKLFVKEAKSVVDLIPEAAPTSSDVFHAFLTYKTRENGKTIACEQTPRNVLYISEILHLYPESRIINMIRDPRDVLLSQKYKWRIRFLGATNIPYREALRAWVNYHPITMSKLWNASVRAATQFAEHPQVRTVKFEDLIVDPERIVTEICTFVGIAYHPEMLEIPQNVGGVSSHKKMEQGQKGIDRSSSEKWKKGGLSSAEIYLCQQMTQANMERYGYAQEPIHANPFTIAYFWAMLPIKLVFALLLNLNRTRNILEAIKRRL